MPYNREITLLFGAFDKTTKAAYRGGCCMDGLFARADGTGGGEGGEAPNGRPGRLVPRPLKTTQDWS